MYYMKNKKKTALISGITGQDGSYLADLLLAKGYRVYGLERRSSNKNHGNIGHLLSKVTMISGDLLDEASLVHAIKQAKPDEVYNLASQSFVGESWKQPVFTGEVTGLGAIRMLEAIRQVNPKIKFYQASSSEMLGGTKVVPQNEKTHFYPRSPYGVAKLYAHWTTINYRESYGIFAVSGILFN
ncbi:MAG: GDP-mannose 4,6-dehydratase, partial [Candidatus Sungbacteria bacterium]|nr:GDP-mannose 4,6-dehydratase [Candidatus Sungbacteria bacterium]